MRYHRLLILVLCCLIAACSGGNTPVANQPTATNPLSESTATRTATPIFSPSPTVSATPVPPTVTHTPTQTGTATQTLSPTPFPPTSAPNLSTEAQDYLEEVLDIMQTHSINKDQIDWDVFRAAVLKKADGASTPADTYDAIQFAIKRLKDGHSHFRTPEEVAEIESGEYNADLFPEPYGEIIADQIGYINLPAFLGMDEVATAYADTVQDAIRELDAQNPCGWMVDLRQNPGGNMWPMLAGIGPILGEGCVGYFVSPDGEEIPWCYSAGEAYEGEQLQQKVSGEAYQLKNPMPPVAVIMGEHTSSSGETIVVAFRQRPDSRSFGKLTGGYTTANEWFVLSDGAWLLLTVSTYADRTGQIYDGRIPPDETLRNPVEPYPQKAIDWLLEQPACSMP